MNIEKGAIGHGNMQNIGFESLEDKEIILKLLKKYGNYLNTSKTETHERYKFFSRTMNDNESIEDFIADLRQKAKTCNFQSLADNFVRDKIIFDTKDEILRQFLLDTEDIDLEKIITIYKIYEKTRGKMNEVCKDKVIQGRNTNITPAIKSAQITCSNCGTHHVYGNCPAFHSRCMKCNGLRHYTKMCNRHWARKNYKRNKSGSNAGGPFSQIKKNRKVGDNAGDKIWTTSNKKQEYLPGDRFPHRIPPPKYTEHPVPTKAYNSGSVEPSTSQEKPVYNLQNNVIETSNNIYATSQSSSKTTHLPRSMQNASTVRSGTKSTPSSVSDNAAALSHLF
ncbi:uncharacterized protein LOC107267509 isoform X1 [Cephus cinctus]|uniref:Uncharacterized protein LOC107267509 isoform X1 n=1 Tax=Cephus cinctus TaxID=211228 RepID=A0AAJ7RGQ2_CEPCN|nr:uncharacterized protein LOC107267509 isoform X1 [Cephus cinctus]